MSNLYNEFEGRFTAEWFSCGWSEDVKPKEIEPHILRKDLNALQFELNEIQEHIEAVAQKQLRLANLAKLYE